MTEIILCRHGQTDWNTQGRYQGRTDVPLNDFGRQQARQLAGTLADMAIHVVYSSTLERAYDTAVEIATPRGLQVRRDARLDEIDQGQWEGMRHDEIMLHHPEKLAAWQDHPIDLRLPEGETLEEVRMRVRDALDDMMLLHQGLTICVVAHSVSMAVVKHELQGMTLREALATLPPNASWERIPVPKYDLIRAARL
ncbi:MAG: histidine phosphatase family protein [Chloroflexi bacterium]|nr:histidine phosphatase family protein [Chloroflexota bacterium]